MPPRFAGSLASATCFDSCSEFHKHSSNSEPETRDGSTGEVQCVGCWLSSYNIRTPRSLFLIASTGGTLCRRSLHAKYRGVQFPTETYLTPEAAVFNNQTGCKLVTIPDQVRKSMQHRPVRVPHNRVFSINIMTMLRSRQIYHTNGPGLSYTDAYPNGSIR